MIFAFVLTLVAPTVLGLPITRETTCGYQACPTSVAGKLNVHVVPHTHDDVGWLKTVDQYFYGSHTEIQRAGVQYIIDSVVSELLQDPSRRFVYVETAFLWKWWQEQTPERQAQVRQLVDSGRLEIIGGAWSMNDEGAAHYHSIVDQFSWGLRKLNETLGRCARPRVGWQIDPFGHSREMASLLSQMGYDGLFLGRIDYQDKESRQASKNMEEIWAGSDNLGDSATLFTHALFNRYSPPSGFCFDVLCGDEPIIDDINIPDYNVDKRVEAFLSYVRNQASYYKSDNIILTMGDDFNYQDAAMWFKNLDKLIKYTNERDSTVNVFYSTPGCYLKAVNDAGLTWGSKKDDFFPYASDAHSYWTGYFTSRPTSKYFERQGNNFLQVCKQLAALAQLTDEDNANITVLREAMGVMQHHDAITGTEKQAVFSDYSRILSKGFDACQGVVNKAINKLAAPNGTVELNSCLLLNVSQCAVSESASSFMVTVYNPLSRPVTHFVRLPVKGNYYSVQDPQGTELTVQLIPLPPQVVSLPERTSKTTNDIVFKAVDLPPLGFRTYRVTELESAGSAESTSTKSEDLQISNEVLSVSLNATTGRIQTLNVNGTVYSGGPLYMYYEGFLGDNGSPEKRSSGAYVFRPNGTSPVSFPDKVNITTYKGPLVNEIHQTISDWVSQVIRLYSGEDFYELEWLVGPIPIQDGIGKEVIIRYTSDSTTNGLFYTDSNGRELLERKRDYRPTWAVELNESIAGNYYPITSRILLRDEKKQLEMAVLNDRAQGGSSLHDGELELMVHRRLLHDDAFGVGEALNETAYNQGLITRGHHYLILGNISGDGGKSAAARERTLAQQKLLSPWILVTPTGDVTQAKLEFSGLQQALPSNIQILTLEPWLDGSLLLRLEHIFETGEDEQLSQSATVNLQNLFPHLSIVAVQEMTLDGNELLQDMHRLQWNVSDGRKTPQTAHHQRDDLLNVTLSPMQIRTFVLQVTAIASHIKQSKPEVHSLIS